RAYEEAIEATSTKDCPWYVVPSDHRWYRNLLVAKVLVHTLKELKMDWPLPAEDAVLAAAARPGAGQGG
ncbi:MAG: polyphosphate kinase 2 family protein, partial [Sulfobacillus sp.]